MSYKNYLILALDQNNLMINDLRSDLQLHVWRPTIFNCKPPDLGFFFVTWSIFNWLRIFLNCDYSIIYIFNSSKKIIHRSCVVPTYFRWPFMAENDLQISSTWTAPDWRGQGLATYALMYIVKSMSASNRQFWYVTRDANIPSIKVAQKAGFKVVGNAVRVKRFGSDLLGYLRMIDR
jgi:RimJ/RimL family protein N-acetyltransferase